MKRRPDKAMQHSSYAREENDFYPTPIWVTEAVMPTLKMLVKPGVKIWEPACGSGAICRVLEHEWTGDIYASDLNPHPDFRKYTTNKTAELMGKIDFLGWQGDFSGGVIITNPPYSGKLPADFIRTALEKTHPDGTVAMLLRSDYDQGSTRKKLFAEAGPFFMELALSPRPIWIPGTDSGARHYYSWFIWSWERGPNHPALKRYYYLDDPKRNRAFGDIV